MPRRHNAPVNSPAEPFDTYAAYTESVQDPGGDARELRRIYYELRGKNPRILREDFCAAFALSCAWVRLDPKHQAVGLDLASRPLEYGRAHHLARLKPDQQKRVSIIQRNVIGAGLPAADIICAMNFSHYIIRDRPTMLRYFRHCRAALRPKGVFLACCFGGRACDRPNVEGWKLPGYRYFFEQTDFDPISNFATFHIHFKPDRQPKIEKAFTYHWRMWSIPEMRDLMAEAGFRRSHVYWEEFDRNGEGTGRHVRRETGEECESWTAYIVGEK